MCLFFFLENADGLDNSMSLRYYGRMRFVENLASIITPPLARVVSVLGGGKEGKIEEANLDLRNYSVVGAAAHTGTNDNTCNGTIRIHSQVLSTLQSLQADCQVRWLYS